MPETAQHNLLPELTPETYTSRELSWIEFNRRVLALAQDTSLPLLERAKFLAIFSNNLDEFYMVRVASWHNKMRLGLASSRPDSYQPRQLLMEIRRRVMELIHQQRDTLREVLDNLCQAGICLVKMNNLTPDEQAAVAAYFQEEVFPVLTPLAVDHARPFPFISNLSLNLAIWLRRSNAPIISPQEFVRLKIPDVLPRLVDLNALMRRYGGKPRTEDTFLWLEDVIADNLYTLFPGMEVVEFHSFRVTRNADIDFEHEQEDRLLDMSAMIEESLREREFGNVVRLSVTNSINERTLNRLIQELGVDPEQDIYQVDGPLGGTSLFELASINRPEHKYPPYVPRMPEILSHQDIFAAIRQSDILLHLPYDSFLPVEDFFRAAAHDPDVLAIKATLYRVGRNSPIVQALAEARENDKQVAVLVELKARFDEENNIEWARVLERQGVHVTYGVEELPVKTHAKVALVVRREAGGVRRYVHLGTGNYNPSTARQYTDLGIFTSNHEIGTDALNLFNRLTGYAPAAAYRHLLVAPEHLHKHLMHMIDGEIAAARAGKPARLIFKMNQLEEDVIIQKLYQASQAGVEIDLLVRGLCCLNPGVPGISETIRVRSIVGRYLEHSRIFYFHNAPVTQRLYLGSADLMRRNLYNRVEVVFPVLDPRLQRSVMRILVTSLIDNQNAWELQPDGYYERVSNDGPRYNSQDIFMENTYGIEDLPGWWSMERG
ncbi:MAG: polyphosphate kinase 1 [Anaerolineaceae bacterium]|nr:polyphosphate kinase 1 [Anaerolineaceae bacterium]